MTQQPQSYNYLEDYLDYLRSIGKYAFTSEELRQRFHLTDEALKKAIQRLKRKKKVALVRQGFYVIVPPEYSSSGMLPPAFFIPDLMNFLGKNYYMGLLNAAAIYGSAHQQAQEFFVITNKPTIRPVKTGKLIINFCYRKSWSKEDISDHKTEAGFIKVSSPELTALDLVFFAKRVGGLNRIATALDELAPGLNDTRLAITATRFNQVASIQRLGYMLDYILGYKSLTQPLLKYLQTVRYFPLLLRPQHQKPSSMKTDNPWRVVKNIEVESEA